MGTLQFEVTILIALAFVAITLLGIFVVLRITGLKSLSRRDYPYPVAETGVDSATGELTVGAKYAIWTYMFSILGVGGAVIGIVAGVVGYMINDLAKANAIQVALSQMQQPLANELAHFSDAKSALDTAVKNVNTDAFQVSVAGKLAEDLHFQKTLIEELGADSAFRARLAEVLFNGHSSELRGATGSQGPAGKDGVNGTGPTADAVGESLSNDLSFRNKLAEVFFAHHNEQLRGPVGPVGKDGPMGPAGPTGKDGATGQSPSTTSVSETLSADASFRSKIIDGLLDHSGDRLRGPAGPPGKDGATGPAGPAGRDGLNGPSNASVIEALSEDLLFRNRLASTLATQHGDQLRGLMGPGGKDGPPGPPGAIGKDGVPGKDGPSGTGPTLAVVADALSQNPAFRDWVTNALAFQYTEQLRGLPGTPGKDGPPGPAGKDGPGGPIGPAGPAGKDGATPAIDAVATELVVRHSAQLRRAMQPLVLVKR